MTRFKKVSIYFTLTLASVLLLLVTILAGNNNNYNNNNLSVDGEAYQLLLRQQDQTTTKPNEVIATGLEVVFDLEIKVIEKENTHKISKITFEISNTTTISTIMDVTNFNTVNSNGVSEDWKYKQGSTNKSLELYLEETNLEISNSDDFVKIATIKVKLNSYISKDESINIINTTLYYSNNVEELNYVEDNSSHIYFYPIEILNVSSNSNIDIVTITEYYGNNITKFALSKNSEGYYHHINFETTNNIEFDIQFNKNSPRAWYKLYDESGQWVEDNIINVEKYLTTKQVFTIELINDTVNTIEIPLTIYTKGFSIDISETYDFNESTKYKENSFIDGKLNLGVVPNEQENLYIDLGLLYSYNDTSISTSNSTFYNIDGNITWVLDKEGVEAKLTIYKTYADGTLGTYIITVTRSLDLPNTTDILNFQVFKGDTYDNGNLMKFSNGPFEEGKRTYIIDTSIAYSDVYNIVFTLHDYQYTTNDPQPEYVHSIYNPNNSSQFSILYNLKVHHEKAEGKDRPAIKFHISTKGANRMTDEYYLDYILR